MVQIDLEKFKDNKITNKTGFSLDFGYFAEEDAVAYVYSFRGKEIEWYKTLESLPNSFKESIVDYYNEYEYTVPLTSIEKIHKVPSIQFRKHDIIITSKYGEEFIILCKSVGNGETKFILFVEGIIVKETFNLEIMIRYIMGVSL